MADEECEIAVVRYHLYAVLLAKYWMLVRRRKRKPRDVWTRQWISRRPEFGIHDQLLVELRREDPKSFKKFLRMEPAMYDEIVQRVGPRVTKNITWFRKPLSPDIKIAVTLRHLASGAKYRDTEYGWKPNNTLSNGLRAPTSR